MDSDPSRRGAASTASSSLFRVAYDTLSRRPQSEPSRRGGLPGGERRGRPDEIVEVIASTTSRTPCSTRSGRAVRSGPRLERGSRARRSARPRSRRPRRPSAQAFEAAAEPRRSPWRSGPARTRGRDGADGNHVTDAERLFTEARTLFTDAGDVRGAARAAAGLAQPPVVLGTRPRRQFETRGGCLCRARPRTTPARTRRGSRPSLRGCTTSSVTSRPPGSDRGGDHHRGRARPRHGATGPQQHQVARIPSPARVVRPLAGALEIALDHDLGLEALRAYNNLLAQLEPPRSRRGGDAAARAGALTARRRGDRQRIHILTSAAITENIHTGRWAGVGVLAEEYAPEHLDINAVMAFTELAELAWQQEDAAGRRWLERAVAPRVTPATGSGVSRCRRSACPVLRGRSAGRCARRAEHEVAEQLESREQDVLVARAARAAASPRPGRRPQARRADLLHRGGAWRRGAQHVRELMHLGVVLRPPIRSTTRLRALRVRAAAARGRGNVRSVAGIPSTCCTSSSYGSRGRGGAARGRGARDRRGASAGSAFLDLDLAALAAPVEATVRYARGM